MNAELQQLINTGSIPYHYEMDWISGLYFALAIALVLFSFALLQALATMILGA